MPLEGTETLWQSTDQVVNARIPFPPSPHGAESDAHGVVIANTIRFGFSGLTERAAKGDITVRRRRRWLVATALSAVVAAAGIALPAGSAAAESNGGVRVMPLGDSIT